MQSLYCHFCLSLCRIGLNWRCRMKKKKRIKHQVSHWDWLKLPWTDLSFWLLQDSNPVFLFSKSTIESNVPPTGNMLWMSGGCLALDFERHQSACVQFCFANFALPLNIAMQSIIWSYLLSAEGNSASRIASAMQLPPVRETLVTRTRLAVVGFVCVWLGAFLLINRHFLFSGMFTDLPPAKRQLFMSKVSSLSWRRDGTKLHRGFFTGGLRVVTLPVPYIRQSVCWFCQSTICNAQVSEQTVMVYQCPHGRCSASLHSQEVSEQAVQIVSKLNQLAIDQDLQVQGWQSVTVNLKNTEQ